jgi:DNA-binding NarL/FixJ family response regulator
MVPGADPNTTIRTMKLRVVAVDDNAAFLREFTGILGTEFDVVATAVDGESALECVRRYRPDVVVLDLEMPRLNGIQVTKELAADPMSPAVVICSVEDDPEIIDAARQAGALGYVVKARIREDLIAAVKSAARGQSFVSPV